VRDLYKRSRLISGQPVNDQTVAAKIKNGGPNMPGYQYTLTEKDLADLVSFLREGKCCWEDFEEKEPPPNPRYKATADEFEKLTDEEVQDVEAIRS